MRVEILGCPIDDLSFEETIEAIQKMIESKKPHQHVVINVNKLLLMRKDKKLKEIISKCSLINPDGMPLVWISYIFRRPLKERITGLDLMESLIKLSADRGYKVYFLGAKEEVIKKVVEIYKRLYPSLKIVGYRNGYWDIKEERKVVDEIRQSLPDILFVGMSSPKKEYFLNKYLEVMNVPFAMGVGGSFDVIAGKFKRAPLWAQRIGLEWLFRFFQEPKRLASRYIIGNTIFLFLVIKEIIKKALNNLCFF